MSSTTYTHDKWHAPWTEYRDGCWNCAHCFARIDYDAEPQFYCTLGAGERPRCGSCLMDEHFNRDRAASRAWDAWAMGREVWPLRAPTCGEWVAKAEVPT